MSDRCSVSRGSSFVAKCLEICVETRMGCSGRVILRKQSQWEVRSDSTTSNHFYTATRSACLHNRVFPKLCPDTTAGEHSSGEEGPACVVPSCGKLPLARRHRQLCTLSHPTHHGVLAPCDRRPRRGTRFDRRPEARVLQRLGSEHSPIRAIPVRRVVSTCLCEGALHELTLICRKGGATSSLGLNNVSAALEARRIQDGLSMACRYPRSRRRCSRCSWA